MSLWGFFIMSIVASLADAQPRTSGEQRSEQTQTRPQLSPPRLTEFVEATYPPQARQRGLEATVTLRLTIDATGRVTRAEVVEPTGRAFDEAARQAVLQFRFEPARRGDTPIPSRILYTYTFTLPEPPPRGEVVGRILMPDGDEGAGGALVTLEAKGGQAFEAHADVEGRFRFEEVPPGTYTLSAGATGGGGVEISVVVEAGEVVEPMLTLLAEEAEKPLDVTVRGTSRARELRESAQAVEVVETEEEQKQAADLGEVLARTKGVGVRRSGGLGSGASFSINGLSGDQVRFFLDGVPLRLAGYPFGVANVPVNLVERVDIYRGVVPIRFGADALGGAVNVVTSDAMEEGTHGEASYQVGSFGTHRLTLGARHFAEPLGLFVRAQMFLDHADNDYAIEVEVPNEVGRLSPAHVYRFHDEYDARGANLEIGVVQRPWADRLSLRLTGTEYLREIQHNVIMTIPYGEVAVSERSAGGTLRYEHSVGDDLSWELITGYLYGRVRFVDVGDCVYDWFGRCVRERRVAGEIEPNPRDQVLWDHNGFARIHARWRIHDGHQLRLTLSPTYTTRTGDERRQSELDERDPLTAERDLFTQVTGASYEVDALEDALENVAFFKHYLQIARSEEPQPGDVFARRDRTTSRYGIGDALRYRLAPYVWAKISYEWATRLPRPEELFGDGRLIVDNLELEPETSHNGNVGLTLDLEESAWGAWRADVHGFLRETDNQIILLGSDRVFSFQNVFSARALGVEASAGWSSPGQWVSLAGNFTYQDYRNTSDLGTFGDFDGDRIPNIPYLFANGSARLQYREAAAPNDELALTWNTRYVHEFFRGWESAGLRRFKQTVDAQLTHAISLTYAVAGEPLGLSFAGEVQNLTDAQVFDFFGVQRPGRAFYFKTTAQF